ncbi:hypothetical protein EVAR_69327_1 [Eumeta japonica]|uniref:Uncharacterized protein n=1 Tax=Eumeta variegata TaxID=151549 RepID=A0A4C2A5F9_EUMVA|nr:hypothetical protein EVAR_69327_1 [Eumeta japonica]
MPCPRLRVTVWERFHRRFTYCAAPPPRPPVRPRSTPLPVPQPTATPAAPHSFVSTLAPAARPYRWGAPKKMFSTYLDLVPIFHSTFVHLVLLHHFRKTYGLMTPAASSASEAPPLAAAALPAAPDARIAPPIPAAPIRCARAIHSLNKNWLRAFRNIQCRVP